MQRRIVAAARVAVAVIGTGAASLAAAATIRSADHPGFSRIVVDLPQPASAQTTLGADDVVIRLDNDTFAAAAPHLRNVLALSIAGSELVIKLGPGVEAREQRLDGRLVIDALDPPSASPKSPVSRQPVAAPHPSGTPPIGGGADRADRADATAAISSARLRGPADRHREDTGAGAPVAEGEVAGSSLSRADPAQDGAPPIDPNPVTSRPERSELGALAPTAMPPALHDQSASFTIPFGPAVGAAMFRRGNVAYIVFDARRSLDLGGLQNDAIVAPGEVRLSSAATLLRLTLAADAALALGHAAEGWTVGVTRGPAAMRSIDPYATKAPGS